jgi:hypothetical protein
MPSSPHTVPMLTAGGIAPPHRLSDCELPHAPLR